MSVQITKQPKAVSFSRNPVVFQFQTNGLYKEKGRPYIAGIFFNGYENVSVPIAYGDIKLSFLGVANPDDSGTQIHARTSDLTDFAYAELVANDLKSNYYLNRDFIIGPVVERFTIPYITFTARKNGTGFNISTDTITYITQYGGDDVLNSNFKLYVELWLQTSPQSLAQKFSDAYLEVDADGIANLDISGQLTDAMLANGFDRPDFANPIAKVNTSTCTFYLQYAEVYGDVQTIRRVLQTPVYNALLGGISKEMLTTFQLPDSFLAGGKLRFLKQDLAEKYLLPEQAEFLSIVLFTADVTGVSLKFTVYFQDGTTAVVYKFALGNVTRYSKLTFPVGFVQNNLNLIDDSKPVIKYSVVLVDSNNTELSETRTYWLDYEYRQFVRQFIYLSSMGTYDTLVAFGRGSSQYELVQNVAEIASDKGFLLADGDKINYSNSLNNTETVTSGYREKAEIRMFKDLALSVDMLLYRKKRVYAVAFSSKTVKEFKDGENLHAISFDFGFRYNEQLFTVDDQDDIDTPLFTPFDFAGAPEALPLPDGSLDYRYYKKIETYNQAEINNKIKEVNDSLENYINFDGERFTYLLGELENKATAVHDHDGRYIPREEMNDLIIQLDDIIKNGAKTSLDEAVTSDVTIGGITVGDTLDKGLGFTGFVKQLIVKTFFPTFTAPSFGLGHAEGGNIEVGTTLDVDLVFNYNRGSINPTWQGGTSLPYAGTAYAYRFYFLDDSGFETVGGPNYVIPNYSVKAGSNVFKADVLYNAGQQPKDSKGNDYAAPLAGGTSPKVQTAFNGYYATWYGPVSAVPGTPAAVRNLPGKQPTSSGNSFILNSGTTQTTLIIITAPGKTLSNVTDLDSLQAVITSEYVYQGTISVNDAAGVAIPGFKLYVKQMGVAYTQSKRHQITLS